MKNIILASASPRRKELLERIGLKFEVVKSDFEEKFDPKLDFHTLAERLSLGKAKAVAKRFKNSTPILSGSIIIAADTLIIANREVLGKPKDKNDAKNMLNKLSGKMHLVITGFTIIDTQSKKTITKSDETKVYMRKITNKEIENYIKTKEPFGKAGAYAVQEKGSVFVEKIEGDFFNVVGLPIFALMKELKKFGVSMLG